MRARMCRGRVAAAVIGASLCVVAAGSPAVAADRAVELVTPSGEDPRVLLGGVGATPDGNFVCFNSERAMGGSTPNGLVTTSDGFCSRRTPQGWQTTWVTGPAPEGETAANRGSQVFYIAPDASRVVFASDTGLYPDYRGAGPGMPAIYPTVSAFMWEGGGMPRWLSPTPVPLTEGNDGLNNREILAVSEDLRYGVFTSRLRLLPEDGNAERDVYKYTPDGIQLVSRNAAGQAVGGEPPMYDPRGQPVTQPGALSEDGMRAFFHHNGAVDGAGPEGVRNVFMEENGRVTHISHRRGPAGPPLDVHFEGASKDGSIVYLRSSQQLTDEPTTGADALYRYDVEADELSLVASKPAGTRLLELSADGSTVVFDDPIFGIVYVWRNGEEEELGTEGTGDWQQLHGGIADIPYGRKPLRISDDGSVVVFAADGVFDDSPPSGAFPAPFQVYRWTPEDGIRRISNPDPSAVAAGSSFIGNFTTQLTLGLRGHETQFSMRQFINAGRVLADDGRVFFETTEPLTPDDINRHNDVYEWHNGTTRLVTPGTQQEHAFYHDSSADGSTVFFTTDARLIPELDRNGSADLYAARIGGGFPLPDPPKRCAGEECQGSPPAPPEQPRPRSDAFQGPSDVADPAPKPDPRQRLMGIAARQRKAFARRGRTVLRIRISEPGWVSATATARIGRRSVRVASAVRRGRSRGVVKVPLVLSRRARAVLRRGRALRLVITVGYSKSEETVSRVVVLRG